MATPPKSDRRNPVVLDLEETHLPPAPTPAEAPPVPDPGSEAAKRMLMSASQPGFRFGRALAGLGGGLVVLALSVATHDFIMGLYDRNLWLGSIGFALALGLLLVLFILLLREGAALARLSRIESLRSDAARADVKRLLPGMRKLYGKRPELEVARSDVTKAVRETPDAATIVATAERAYLTPLDGEVEGIVSRAARDVAAATALIPMPAVDVAAVLWINLRMIRRIGEIYGGRSGWFGSMRLLRAVAAHLVATGAIAATDDVLGPLVGGGVLGTLSRRFGEAAVNAALTARVGVSAMEVCRPMPFKHRPKPRASSLVLEALKGWRSRDEKASERES